jgi:hypothetical protein
MTVFALFASVAWTASEEAAGLGAFARGEAPSAAVLDELYDRGVPGPTARRPVNCLPVQGLGC